MLCSFILTKDWVKAMLCRMKEEMEKDGTKNEWRSKLSLDQWLKLEMIIIKIIIDFDDESH